MVCASDSPRSSCAQASGVAQDVKLVHVHRFGGLGPGQPCLKDSAISELMASLRKRRTGDVGPSDPAAPLGDLVEVSSAISRTGVSSNQSTIRMARRMATETIRWTARLNLMKDIDFVAAFAVPIRRQASRDDGTASMRDELAPRGRQVRRCPR